MKTRRLHPSVAVLLIVATSAFARTLEWRDRALTVYWSDPGNWDPATSPMDGDTLVFPRRLNSETASQNDLTGLRLNGISIERGQFLSLYGNNVTISNGISIFSPLAYIPADLISIHCPITLARNQSIGTGGDLGQIITLTNINLNGFNLTFPPLGRVTLNGEISGAGSISQAGGDFTLSRANTFTGSYTISGNGRVFVNNPESFGAWGNSVMVMGGTVLLNEVDVNGISLSLRLGSVAPMKPSSWSGPIILTNVIGPVSINSSNYLELSGPLSGAGNLRLGGPEVIAFAGIADNSYLGTITVECKLALKKTAARAIAGPLVVSSGAEVLWAGDYQASGVPIRINQDAFLNLMDFTEDFGRLDFYGGVLSLGTGQGNVLQPVNFYQSWAPARIVGGVLNLPAVGYPSNFFNVVNDTGYLGLIIDSPIAGDGALIKRGHGTLILGGRSSHTGLTLVEEGVLQSTSISPLGTGAAGTIVQEGATLWLNSCSLLNEQISLAGSGVGGTNGALRISGTVNTQNQFPSIYPCLELATNVTIRVDSDARLTVDGVVSGIGPLTKNGLGLLEFININSNTYSGDTIVTEGVLNLGKPNFALSVPGNLTVGPAPLNSSAIARWSTSGGMNPGATATINARSLLDLNGYGLSLARLNLNDGGDAQTGDGHLDFPSSGMVAVGSLSQLGSHSSSTFSGNIGLPANATLTFAVNGYAPTAPFDFNPELTVSASMTAPPESPIFERAGIAKTGMGTLRLSGGNSFNGRSEVMEGTLIAAHSLALGSSFDGTFVLNSAKLALEGGLSIQNEILVLGSTATPALESLSGESYWNGPVIMNQHSTVGTSTDSLLHLAGVISGAANFTKVGPGTLRFEGGNHNTYSGQTFVNEGTLLLSKPFVITAVPGVLNIGTPLGLPATVANVASYQVVGNIIVNRGGLLNINDQIENVDHLWLYEGGDIQTTTGTLFLKAGGSIQVFPGGVGDTSTIAGNLDMDGGPHFINIGANTGSMPGPSLDITALITSSLGAISIQKIGTGTMRLAANNTYSGSTTINAGVLQVDGTQPSSSVIIGDDARLSGSGRVGPVTFAGPSGVLAPGTSPGILQSSSFNSGGAGGILQIELNGLTAGAEYDRLFVNGLATLEGMTLQAAVNFAAPIGSQFMIVGNNLSDAIQGTFNGLPQNATVTFGDHIFHINYSGGDGNDVVLTKVGDVYRPRLAIQPAGSNSMRLLWPTNDPGFVLESSTNFITWNLAPGSPMVSGTNFVTTNLTTGIQQLYRLFKP